MATPGCPYCKSDRSYDFLRWKQEKPEEYERWYQELKEKA